MMSDEKKIKVMLVNFVTGEMSDVVFELQKKGMEVIYWLGGKERFHELSVDKEGFPSTVFHHNLDAIQGIPPKEFQNVSIPPVDAQTNFQLSKQELTLQYLMDRIDYTGLRFYHKKELYHKCLSYWLYVLKELKPDAIVFSDLPHLYISFLIYSLAHLLGIKTLICRRVKGFPERVMVFNDFTKYSELLSAYQLVEQENLGINDLSEDIKTYYQQQVSARSGAVNEKYSKHIESPDKGRGTKLLPPLKVVVYNIKKFHFFKTALLYLRFLFKKKRIESLENKTYRNITIRLRHAKWNRLKKKYRAEYESLLDVFDGQKKFIYIPLHYQPECTTAPMGGVYADQILMVNTVAASLPDDWIVYVKENKIQWSFPYTHATRYSGYYKEMKKNKKVCFVSTDTSTFDLINYSQAVATVTGTAGWEAIMRLKPVLLFGFPWYMHCEGIFRVDSVEGCKRAVEKIKTGFVLDEKRILRYLSAMEMVSAPGYLHKRYAKNSGVSREQNTKNISDYIYECLNKNK